MFEVIVLLGTLLVGVILGWVLSGIHWCRQPLHNPERIQIVFVLKADNPDVNFVLEVGEVTDSEGNVVEGAQLDLSVESDNADAISATFDAATKTGSIHVGAPGDANVTAKASVGGNVLAQGVAAFHVTAGDPAAVTGISLQFDGISEV